MIRYIKDEDEELVIPCGLGPVVCNDCGYDANHIFYSLDYIAVHSLTVRNVKAYASYLTDFTPDEKVTCFEAKFKAPIVEYDPLEPIEEERDNSYFVFGCSNKLNSTFRFGVWVGHNNDLHIDFGSHMTRSVTYLDDEINFQEGVKIKAWREGDVFTVEVNDDPDTRKSAAVEDLENLNTVQIFGRKNIENRIIHSAAGTEISYVKIYGEDGLLVDFWPYLADNDSDMSNFVFLMTDYNGECNTRRFLEPYATRDGYVDGERTCPEIEI